MGSSCEAELKPSSMQGAVSEQPISGQVQLFVLFPLQFNTNCNKPPCILYSLTPYLFLSTKAEEKKKTKLGLQWNLTGSQIFLHIFSDTKCYWDPSAVDRAAEQPVRWGLFSGGKGCKLMHKTQKILFTNPDSMAGWLPPCQEVSVQLSISHLRFCLIFQWAAKVWAAVCICKVSQKKN